MRLAYTGLMFFLLAVVVGCQSSDPYSRYKLGSARDVVAGAIGASGGLDAWRSVDKIHAVANITNYDEDGTAHIDRVHVTISPWSDSISARGVSPQGPWHARLSDNGRITMTGQGTQDGQVMRDILAVILHRSLGTLNLLVDGEKVLNTGRTKISGEELSKVRVASSKGYVMAYYFSASNNLLRYITDGADAPGGDGTLTIFGQGKKSYVTLKGGLTMPSSFKVVRIGQHVLPSDQKVMEVELTEIRAE